MSTNRSTLPRLKPIFTVHEGEFLVGDHINRKFGRKYNVWVPTKDIGVDLLVTRKRNKGKPLGLQVKFSRSFDIHTELLRDVLATSWYTLNPETIRQSQADLWVFVFMTLRHEKYFVLVPTAELQKRIPRNCGSSKWNLYLSAFGKKRCYQVRGLNLEGKLNAVHRGVQDQTRDFSKWFENWKLLEELTR